jgi:MFS-type transporter involved in bile tolerance (Atg22 family)
MSLALRKPVQILGAGSFLNTGRSGTKKRRRTGGLFFCIAEIGGFMGPFLLGALVDWTGGFLAGGYFVVALSFGILFMSFMMQKKAIESFRSL